MISAADFMCSATHYFNLGAVGQLLNSVAVLCVELQQNGHLEGGCLERKTNISICILYKYTCIKCKNAAFQEPDLESVSQINERFSIKLEQHCKK